MPVSVSIATKIIIEKSNNNVSESIQSIISFIVGRSLSIDNIPMAITDVIIAANVR